MGPQCPHVRQPLPTPSSCIPTLVVVVDTEEEFDWTAPFNPANTSVQNIPLQTLAQRILDSHGVRPTYVIDYPVASNEPALAVLRTFALERRCEIGAHLHPWVNPPAEGPIDEIHSFPGNLPTKLERDKLRVLTESITRGFGTRPVVYKAGRYGLGQATPGILQELGYTVDVSVVPHTDFSEYGGPDFRNAPPHPFLLAPGLCELPLSVHFTGLLAARGNSLSRLLSGGLGRKLKLEGAFSRVGLLTKLRLSPEGHSLAQLTEQTRIGIASGTRLFMLTYHSSSLLPGGNPYVRSESERDAFVATLDGYLRFFRHEAGGRVASVHDVAASLLSRTAA